MKSYHEHVLHVVENQDMCGGPSYPLLILSLNSAVSALRSGLSRQTPRMLLARSRPADLAGPGKRGFFRTMKLESIGQASGKRSVLMLCLSQLLKLEKHCWLSKTEFEMEPRSPSSIVGQLEKKTARFPVTVLLLPNRKLTAQGASCMRHLTDAGRALQSSSNCFRPMTDMLAPKSTIPEVPCDTKLIHSVLWSTMTSLLALRGSCRGTG